SLLPTHPRRAPPGTGASSATDGDPTHVSPRILVVRPIKGKVKARPSTTKIRVRTRTTPIRARTKTTTSKARTRTTRIRAGTTPNKARTKTTTIKARTKPTRIRTRTRVGNARHPDPPWPSASRRSGLGKREALDLVNRTGLARDAS